MKLNDMLAPEPIRLPEDPAATAVAEENTQLKALAVTYPNSPLVWALLAESALDQASERTTAPNNTGVADPTEFITAYAYARTGYHRGLDRLRGNGWKGFGPVPYEHHANRGVLRAIAALAHAAQAIGESEEYDRLRQMLSDADPTAVALLLD